MLNTSPVRFAVVDDNRVQARSIQRDLGDGFALIGNYANLAAALVGLPTIMPRLDLIFCDLAFPDEPSTWRSVWNYVEPIAARPRFVMISLANQDIQLLMNTGVDGFLNKNDFYEADTARAKVESILDGARVFPNLSPRSNKALSPEDHELVITVGSGRQRKNIATDMGISTVALSRRIKRIREARHMDAHRFELWARDLWRAYTIHQIRSV